MKSHRGGSRKKGVKKVRINRPVDDSTLLKDADELLQLPCIGRDGEIGTCPNGHDETTCELLATDDVSNLSNMRLPCHKKNGIARTEVTMESMQRQASNGYYLKQTFDTDAIISNYYNNFHRAHPLLPPLTQINRFLTLAQYPLELIGIMKLLGDGYTSSKYAKDINAIFDITVEVLNSINSKTKDVISLQTLILLSLVCHISALHDLSTSIRKQAIELSSTLDINNLDIDNFVGEDINGNYLKGLTSNKNLDGLTPSSSLTDELNVNFFNTTRVRDLDESTVKDCARRCFWELFFLDIIIGCSDGKTLSALAQMKCFVNFPTIPSKNEFDYETRAHCSKLVDESVRLNKIIFSNMSIGQQYTKLTASLSNWELKFSNPDFYKLPYLIDESGSVNEGIHQGIIMLNYAKIFTHRPLSFLWRSDIPRNMKCVEFLSDQLKNDDDNCQDLPSQKDLINSRKIIETRKTIDAANLIAKTLIDTNPTDVLKRTPLSACSLAFAGLVHLSAYLWSSQISQTKDQVNMNPSDLNIYEEYLKLELSGIYQISQHFYLSSKIANYLMENVSRLLPSLSSKIQRHFKHLIPAKDSQLPSSIAQSPHSLVPSTLETQSSPSIASTNMTPQQMQSSVSYNLMLDQQANATDNSGMGVLTNSSADEPMSPQSDTGCDWIDKNQMDFDFTNMEFNGFDLDTLNTMDDLFKANGTSL